MSLTAPPYRVGVSVAQRTTDATLRPRTAVIVIGQHLFPCCSRGPCAACGGGATLGVGHHVLTYPQVAAVAPRKDGVAHVGSQFRQTLMPILRGALRLRINGDFAEIVQEERFNARSYRALQVCPKMVAFLFAIGAPTFCDSGPRDG